MAVCREPAYWEVHSHSRTFMFLGTMPCKMIADLRVRGDKSEGKLGNFEMIIFVFHCFSPADSFHPLEAQALNNNVVSVSCLKHTLFFLFWLDGHVVSAVNIIDMRKGREPLRRAGGLGGRKKEKKRKKKKERNQIVFYFVCIVSFVDFKHKRELYQCQTIYC